MMKHSLSLTAAISGVLCLAAFQDSSAIVGDLTQNEVVWINTIYGTAIFQTASPKPAGSGFVDNMGDVFLSIKANGTEEGYNTDARRAPMDVHRDGTRFNNALRVGDLQTVNFLGVEYFQFVIDINEPNGGSKSLISIDSIKLFTNTTSNIFTTNPETLGIKRFDLDLPSDSFIKYDDKNSGSGEGDIAFFIPTAAFFNPQSIGLNLPVAKTTDFVYLYAEFGSNISADYSTEGGYEEFWTGRGLTPIPEVSSVLPLAATLLGAFGFQRRRRN